MRGLRGLGERREARAEGCDGGGEGGCLSRWEGIGMAFLLKLVWIESSAFWWRRQFALILLDTPYTSMHIF